MQRGNKNLTQVEKRHRRWRRSNTAIDRAIAYVEETGRCPGCYVKPRGHGITCGDIECIRIWLELPEEGVLRAAYNRELRDEGIKRQDGFTTRSEGE